ncbi:heme peroxidase [Dothidotthia symphoricarpi CBS 119687]|uniref:Heme peroxidase n=1 Tax=Dothidotthia symphoricarpi CBS 119687 TaxID=1392245 RepID=A0A6A6AHC5_9PLEO|nr:heme peroxidase [Dothidotthia symphoricarpi CBS 119687]KAF2131210.1 heme peroxidase [Dothidotthia symphoricarpi CBS 119687]
MTAEAKAAWDAHVDTRTGVTPPKPAEVSELNKLRKAIGGPFKSIASLIGAAAAPVPDLQTGDGSKIVPEENTALYKKIEGGLKDFSYLGVENIQTLLQVQKEKMTGELTDDKTYLMEGLVRTAAALPDGSKMQETVTHQFLTQLWNDLQHPPQSYLGPKFQYRSADGSNNSLVHPQLGAAGTPYARTCKPSMMQTPARPDPGVVFDSIMTRKHAELHPNRVSSMLFYLASIIIHDLFRTSHEDYSVSMTSSYLDLSPLYGSNQKEQDMMRTRVDGKIKPDCFSEARLLFFPPGVGALLIMFNRFHNYTVENLASINEGNRFAKPVAPKDASDEKASQKYEAQKKKYDEDLFQTGRLITCGLYVNTILIDYVRTILNLNRTDSNWQLNPRAEIKGVAMGTGNQVAAEFNLVYRWHSSVSDRDEKWTQEMWDSLFGEGRDPKSIGKYEFVGRMSEVYSKTDPDPSKREFATLKRNADGTLPDDDLVDILTSSVEDCANSFGPNRVPAVFRAIEVLGIEQARSWNLGSLNEFRKYFHLEPHKTFADITSDKYVQDQLKHLYDHPDKVEIYPGLVVEDAKQPMAPGSGLTPPYTTSRAVLSDAVALVRGDRFYTVDYNPRTLTNWGYNLVNSDTSIDNGCVFYKLFLRAFPQHFKQNSVYAHYPLTVPSAMKEALTDLNKAHLYDYEKPKATAHPHIVSEYKLATEIMENQDMFKVTWGKAMEYIMGPAAKDFMLAGDGPKNADSRAMVSKALYISDWDKQVRTYYAAKTKELLAEKGAKIADFNQVDIIRDVGNLAHVHFCAELFMLPLKTTEHPHGIFTEAELYLIMSSVFALIFFDADPAGSFPLHIKAHQATQILGDTVQKNVEAIAHSGLLSRVMQAVWPQDSALKSYGIHMIQRLLASGKNPTELVWGHILGTAGGMVSNQGQLFAQTIEYYILGAGKQHWPAIQALAQHDTPEAFEQLMHYAMEGSRLNGETGVLRAVAKPTTLSEAGKPLPLTPGDTLFVNLRAASHDPVAFPNPDAVDLHRPLDAYIHLGHGPHQCLGLPMTRVVLTTMLREVALLRNLRPALGPQGRIHKVERKMGADEKYPYHAYLTENWDMFFPFPCAFKVNWDDE